MTGRPARTSRLAGLAAATLVAAAGLVGVQASAASAATCSTSGISAVEDATHGAGGGTSTQCDAASGARTASSVFASVGVKVKRNPDGSVCQVNGLPADAPCQRLGTQYWALFWSNGRDGSWIYAQEGDQSLSIPSGGAVAWAWQGSSGQREPGVAAPVVHAAPTPTSAPSPRPTKKPVAAAPTKPRSSVSATPAPATPHASARSRVHASASASTPASPSATTSSAATPIPSDTGTPAATARNVDTTLAPTSTSSGGLPGWVPVSVLVVLAGGVGGALWWRRRSGTA